MNDSPEGSFEEELPDVYDQDGPGLFGDTEDVQMPSEPADETSDLAPLDEESAAPLDDLSSVPRDTSSATRETSAEPDDSADAGPAVQAQPAISSEGTLALYRRYRPETFAEVIGQEHVTDPLQRALVNNKVNHAYLFSGPRGCGKTSSARILARALNCENGPTPVPCGTCDSCIGLGRGGSGTVDVIEIDAASHGGVNEARDLRERAFFSPVNSRYKIYIIDEAHMVTKEGFNALLKVVEEPPPHVKFIFATTEPDKVLTTIRSRTHHYPFRLVPPKIIGKYLQEICESEGMLVASLPNTTQSARPNERARSLSPQSGLRIDPAVLPLVVRAGGGSVRDSLSVLDQLLGGADDDGVSYAHATGLLGFTPDSLLDETVDAISAGDASGVFAAVAKVMDTGLDPRRFAEDLLRRLRDLLIVAAVPEALTNGLIAVSGDQAERLKIQAAGLGPGELTRGAEVIANGLTEMRGTTAPRLHLELMLARVLLPGADVDGRGVHARLDRLERRLTMTTQLSSPSTAIEQDSNGRTRPGPADGSPASPSPTATEQPDADASVPRPQLVDAQPDASENRPPASNPPTRRRPRAAVAQAGEPPDSASVPQPPEVSTQERPDTNVVPIDRRRDQPGESVDARSAEHAPGELSTSGMRSRWPDVLTEVKKRRRFTWILLSQNAQVADVREGVLTLDIGNVGARDSFGRGGSEAVLRDALVEVLGVDLRIRVSDAPLADVSEPAPSVPETPVPRSEGAENARRAARRPPAPPKPIEDEELDRDDPDVDDHGQSSDELLAAQLGAQLIGEEETE